MNRFMVTAKYLDGEVVFTGLMNFVPHKGEEIKVCNRLYMVHHVTYTIHEGNYNTIPVEILLV